MNEDYLPPLFQIGAGLSFLVFLVVAMKARAAFADAAGKMVAFSLLTLPLAMLILSYATRGTMHAGAGMFLAAGIVLLVGVVLIGAGLMASARRLAGRTA